MEPGIFLLGDRVGSLGSTGLEKRGRYTRRTPEIYHVFFLFQSCVDYSQYTCLKTLVSLENKAEAPQLPQSQEEFMFPLVGVKNFIIHKTEYSERVLP